VDPETLVLMPCGYHLPETVSEWERTPRPDWFGELSAVRRGHVFAVDGSAYFFRLNGLPAGDTEMDVESAKRIRIEGPYHPPAK
jgi:ABC-type Fe3+-hydroxamate transport system substrate-binding protein